LLFDLKDFTNIIIISFTQIIVTAININVNRSLISDIKANFTKKVDTILKEKNDATVFGSSESYFFRSLISIIISYIVWFKLKLKEEPIKSTQTIGCSYPLKFLASQYKGKFE
jgi:hypothetical protein